MHGLHLAGNSGASMAAVSDASPNPFDPPALRQEIHQLRASLKVEAGS
jgi:hypothetical protein